MNECALTYFFVIKNGHTQSSKPCSLRFCFLTPPNSPLHISHKTVFSSSFLCTLCGGLGGAKNSIHIFFFSL